MPGLELGAIHDHAAAAGFTAANEFAFFLHNSGAADRADDRLAGFTLCRARVGRGLTDKLTRLDPGFFH